MGLISDVAFDLRCTKWPQEVKCGSVYMVYWGGGVIDQKENENIQDMGTPHSIEKKSCILWTPAVTILHLAHLNPLPWELMVVILFE